MSINIDVTNILQSVPKKARRNSNTIKYGMFGLSLGSDTYDRLDKFCIKNNIAKATLVRSLVQKYLDQVEDK
jgi:predicted DNA-binding protein